MSADRTGWCICSILDLYLKMEVVYPAETLITNYQITQCHIPEYRIMNINLHETHRITNNINLLAPELFLLILAHLYIKCE